MSWFSRLRNSLHSAKLDRELREEMDAHSAERAEALIRRGMSPDEAAREARRRLGNRLYLRESSRNARLSPWIESLGQDLRFGVRMLRKNSSATFAALIALSLAIGACTAAFSLIDALLLRPLPVAAPDRLVALSYPSIVSGRPDGESFSYPALQRFRQTAGTDAGLFGESSNTGLAETTFGSAEPERARVNWISGQAFGIIGVPPALGRTLNTSDEGQSDAAVLGYDFWKRRFGGSPDVLGNVMRTNGRVFRIVGVTREGFSGFEPGFLTDIWLPLESNRKGAFGLGNDKIGYICIIP